MVVQRRNIVTESEKNRILGLYGRPQGPESVVIAEWLSPDEKYCIFFDDLIDIENKTKIGNIWENFDHFKFFLKHSFEVATHVPHEIKESVLESINSLLITESNQNMIGLKPIMKEFLKEQKWLSDAGNWIADTASDAGTWIKDTAVGAAQGVKDFVNTSWEGLKKTYNYIADGEWKKAFDIISKGLLYVMRSIRSAMYNPIGILLDAILIATQIGKGIQWIPWAIVVGLDVYEFITGNYEDPNLAMGWRLLFFGIDLLGLATTGAMAKGARTGVNALVKQFGRTSDDLVKAVRESKFLTGILEKIKGSVDAAGRLMKQAETYLQKNAPRVYNFLKGAFNMVAGWIKKLLEWMVGILKGTWTAVSAPGRAAKAALGGGKAGSAAQATINVGVPMAAVGAYQTGKEREQYQQLSQAIQGSNVKPDYESVEW
jgi:hypothetical protein